MNFSHFKALLPALLALALISSCQKKEETEQFATTDTESTQAEQQQQVVVIPTDNGVAYPNAALTIVSPRDRQYVKPGDSVRIVLLAKGLDVGKPTPGDSARGLAYSNEGAHIHVIVDDKPYMADYRNGQPFNVGVLDPGIHYIRAFPSRSWHESIKTPKAFAVRTFFVGDKPKRGEAVDSSEIDLTKPSLTYSRPKGSYLRKDAEKILLDFYLSNATLSKNGTRINLWVDGKQMPDLTEWVPYYISGLGAGRHTVSMQLVDSSGTVMKGPFNSPKGEFTIE